MAERHEGHFELLLRELQETRVEMRTERRDMRAEMHSMGRDLQAEIRGLRGETQAEIRELRGETQVEIRAVRRDMFHGAIALFAALVAMYATMLVHTLG